jgi:hypothetical protein
MAEGFRLMRYAILQPEVVIETIDQSYPRRAMPLKIERCFLSSACVIRLPTVTWALFCCLDFCLENAAGLLRRSVDSSSCQRFQSRLPARRALHFSDVFGSRSLPHRDQISGWIPPPIRERKKIPEICREIHRLCRYIPLSPSIPDHFASGGCALGSL